jgi:hypothetical protein
MGVMADQRDAAALAVLGEQPYDASLCGEAAEVNHMTTGIEPDRRHIKQDASFVPASREGIRGIVLKIKWKDELPAASEPKARPVNPRLYEHAHKEFKRLCTYMYVPRDGPYASPLVIAHKATSPYSRLCGNYRDLKKDLEGAHFPFPDVKRLLARLQGKKYFIDPCPPPPLSSLFSRFGQGDPVGDCFARNYASDTHLHLWSLSGRGSEIAVLQGIQPATAVSLPATPGLAFGPTLAFQALPDGEFTVSSPIKLPPPQDAEGRNAPCQLSHSEFCNVRSRGRRRFYLSVFRT